MPEKGNNRRGDEMLRQGEHDARNGEEQNGEEARKIPALEEEKARKDGAKDREETRKRGRERERAQHSWRFFDTFCKK